MTEPKNRKRRGRPSGVELVLEMCLPRVGCTPKQHLKWVVEQVNRSRIFMAPGDWLNLRVELVLFAGHGKGVLKGFGGIMGRADQGLEGIDQPSDTATRKILEKFDSTVEKAIRREHAYITAFHIREAVYWDYRSRAEGGQRFRLDEDIQAGNDIDEEWMTQAMHKLGRLIADYGHLLKECPGPAPRSDEGETCGKWFLAGRPNQDFCSALCQSRATTRAARLRARAGMPKGQRGRPRKSITRSKSAKTRKK